MRTLLLFGLAAAASLSLLTVGAGSPPAGAAGNGLYSVFPATIAGSSPRVYFNYLINPGTVVSDAVTVTNQTTSPIAFKLYPADAINGQGGGFALNPPQAPLKSVGGWVKLSSVEFTLPAHSLANVPFTLDVPNGLTPGDYAGGIVLSTVNPSVEKRGNVTFNVFQSVGTRIYVRIRGALHPGLSVTQLSVNTSGLAGYVGGPVSSTVTYTLTNTGNQILNPTAKLSVSPLLGSATTLPRKIFPSLLPHGSATVTYHLPSKEAFLRLNADLAVTSGAGPTNATATAWVIPWILIAIILLIIGFFWYRRRRRRAALAARRGGRGRACRRNIQRVTACVGLSGRSQPPSECSPSSGSRAPRQWRGRWILRGLPDFPNSN